MAFVRKDSKTGCWLWNGSLDKITGYGHFRIYEGGRGRQFTAHKSSYIIFKGSVEEGLQVCHSCDTPACVNPAHLRKGTGRQNQQDSVRKGRRVGGSNPKLSTSLIKRIREEYQRGETQTKLALRYKVSQANISYIVRLKIWKAS
jgi:hypothetical protein